VYVSAPPTIRPELFAADVPGLRDFLERALGFAPSQAQPDYVELTLGNVRIGLGSVAGLPPGHPLRTANASERKGLGVEIVIETDDVDGAYERATTSGYPIAAPLQQRPWRLRDFRVLASDGYYFRVTSRS
jgi:uncharacterized glyoxalase superfamily protein PhnB